MRLVSLIILLAVVAGVGLLVAGCDSSEDTPSTPVPLDTSPDLIGDIVEVHPGYGVVRGTLLIEANEVINSSDKYVVTVKNETQLFKQDGKETSPISWNDLQVGREARVWFGGPVKESYPAQVDAKQIVITLHSGSEVGLGQEFVLAIGQKAKIREENLEITFKEVVGDSRCPRNVTCIWQGEVRLEIQIAQGSASQSIVLTQPGLSDEYARENYDEYEIFFKVSPYPEAGKQIHQDEYRLLMIVAKLDASHVGILKGRVKIGPIRPVEHPGDDPYDIPPEVYDARKVMLYDSSGKNLIKKFDIGHDGYYSVELPPGIYMVDINHLGIDSSSDVPKQIEVRAGDTIELKINIDTGIR